MFRFQNSQHFLSEANFDLDWLQFITYLYHIIPILYSPFQVCLIDPFTLKECPKSKIKKNRKFSFVKYWNYTGSQRVKLVEVIESFRCG